MGYKLPADVDSIDEFAWYLVCIPDDPDFITAALGAYTDIANVWNWGLEEISDDSYTARQLWLDAIGQTIEAHEMGGFALLISLIDDVETLLAALQGQGGCCGDGFTYLPAPTVDNPDGYSYDGPEPSTWGDGETVADNADYQDILCGAAHDYVDYLVHTSNQLEDLVEDSLLTIVAIGSILGALATGGLTLLVEAALASAIFAGITGAWSANMFSDAADDLEDYRDLINCAIFTGDGAVLSDAVEAAVGSAVWLLWYKWIDYQSAINTMLTGELNGEYLVVRRGEDCPCDAPYDAEYTYTFDDDIENWNNDASNMAYDAARDLISAQVSNGDYYAEITVANLRADMGLEVDDEVVLVQVNLDIIGYGITSSSDISIALYNFDNPGWEETSPYYYNLTGSPGDTVNVSFDSPEIVDQLSLLRVKCAEAEGGGSQFIFIDNIRVRVNVTAA